MIKMNHGYEKSTSNAMQCHSKTLARSISKYVQKICQRSIRTIGMLGVSKSKVLDA